jgi:hypothetical protein
MIPCLLVQVLHPPQKSERPPFWNRWTYGIKKYGVEVILNVKTLLLNLIQICWLVIITDGQTDEQTEFWSHKPHIPDEG